jgi:hypothetical protein
MEAPVERIVRVLFIPIGCLIALVVATAAAGVAANYGLLVTAAAVVPDPYRLDGITIVVAGSLVAGTVYAWLLLSPRLSRTLLVGLGLLSLAMLVFEQYLLSGLSTGADQELAPGLALPGQLLPGEHDPLRSGAFLLERAWARDAVPTVGGAVFAVALIVVAAGRRPAPVYLTPYDQPRRPPSALAGGFALVAGAVVWVAVGFALVCLTVVHSRQPLDWSGSPVSPAYLTFGSNVLLYAGAAASIVVGGLLYAFLFLRRLHWSVPVLVGAGFAAGTIWSFVDALARIGTAPPAGRGFTGSNLVNTLQLAPSVSAAGVAAVLAVPLVIAGLRRRRANATGSAVAPVDPDSLEPTLQLY